GFDLGDDATQNLIEIAPQCVVRKIDEADRVTDRLAVEEIELLLVTQHFQRRLTEHGQIQRGPFWSRQCEHHLMRECGLAATRWPCDEIERVLRQTPAQHLVQTGNAGSEAVDDHFAVHEEMSCTGVPLKRFVPTGSSKRSVSERPIRWASNS